jgi:hypothetical protein
VRSSWTHGRAGDPPRDAAGKKWYVLNTIAEHADYGGRYTKRSNQVQRSFEDTQLKQRGLELVLGA